MGYQPQLRIRGGVSRISKAAEAARLPAGQEQTIQEAKRVAAKRVAATHPSLHAYANLRCRCEPCVTMWNQRYKARARAVARLVAAHRDEFEKYLTEETHV